MWTGWTWKDHWQIADSEWRGKFRFASVILRIYRTCAKNTIAFMRFTRKRWCGSRRHERCSRWKIVWSKSRATCSARVETSNFSIKSSASSFLIYKRRRLNRGWTKTRWFQGRMRRKNRSSSTYARTWLKEEETAPDHSRRWLDSAAHLKWLTGSPNTKIRRA